jgi:hypothetical protein
MVKKRHLIYVATRKNLNHVIRHTQCEGQVTGGKAGRNAHNFPLDFAAVEAPSINA